MKYRPSVHESVEMSRIGYGDCLASLRARANPLGSPLPAGDETRFPGDARQAKLAGRYRVMLADDPSEGMALDRLWKLWEEQHATAALVDLYASEATKFNRLPDWLIYGHLLVRADRLGEAGEAYARAAALDPASSLPCQALGELALARKEPAKAAPLLVEAVAKLPSKLSASGRPADESWGRMAGGR